MSPGPASRLDRCNTGGKTGKNDSRPAQNWNDLHAERKTGKQERFPP